MDQTKKTPTTTFKRSPLAERQPRVKLSDTPSKPSQRNNITSPSNISQPHQPVHSEKDESVTSRPNALSSRAANNRVIAIAQDNAEPHKRDSQISNASTVSTTKAKRKTHVGPWHLGRTLGKGATGRVRLAKHASTGQTAAIKIVSKKSAAMVQSASMAQMDNDTTLPSNITGNRTMPFGIEREIVIMKLIDHPNITCLYDIWENRGELYLVLEYVEGGELFEYIMKYGALPEEEAVRLLRQLIAGLAYCHRFNICHRDLKPENLLLDRECNLKIADFGMAALQPNGRNLTTSCGSPHYAAPEIVNCKAYKGSQVDVWSVGIILYAMLHGFLPFDGEGISSTLNLVKKGKYYLSPKLSPEATDLVQKILQLKPNDRITIDEMWTHPLLKKYEERHRSTAPGGHLPGPPPPLSATDCGLRRIKANEIDRELLRNLQILWHGLSEQEVIKRLTSNEPNCEKLFYRALLRFRDEQLENFTGDSLQYSASDYHHIKKPTHRISKSLTRSTLHQRQNSQFSIVSGDSIVRDAYYKNPNIAASKTTQGSYDPYRVSRTPIAHSQKQGTKVVIDRPGSYPSARLASGLSLKDNLHRRAPSSTPDVPSLGSHELQKILELKRSTYSTISSHSSFSTSLRPRTFRKSTSYRRSVTFQHHRQQSGRNTNQSKSNSPRSSKSQPNAEQPDEVDYSTFGAQRLPTPELVHSTHGSASYHRSRDQKPMETPFKDVTRKASTELSKMCEDAFNRSSVSYASELSQQTPLDSPATTISPPPNMSIARAGLTPTLRDLMERRKKIIETWGEADPQTLAALVNTLDERITREQGIVDAATERRSVSDPTNTKSVKAGQRSATLDTMQELQRHRGPDRRASSNPLQGQYNTIRMVTPDPTSPISRIGTKTSKVAPINSLKGGPVSLGANHPRFGHDKHSFAGNSLEPILEDSPRSPMKVAFPESKKWSWLGKKSGGSTEELAPTPPRKDTPKEKQQRVISGLSSGSTEKRKEQGILEENEAKKRHWFQKMFGKRRRENNAAYDNDHLVVQDDLDDLDSVNDTVTPLPRGPTRRGHHSAPYAEYIHGSVVTSRTEASQNWFTKFLHLKPASSILVLTARKGHARKEIVKILRDWRKFGIRDVEVEKRPGGDVVRARVDAANYLHIRPVQFVASVYTVLEKGKTAQLCIAKFTQEKGAASSFHRVVDTMESVLRENDLILTDMHKKKKIMKSMKQAGL